ncbi:MAG: serine/threonine-protein kinase [Isosphaeraceae bacterium]
MQLRGEKRNRAILLLERKKLSLDLEDVAEVFEQLRSPYRLQKVLGQGLFTAAYLARDENSDHDVVVRVLRSELAGQPEARTRFLDLGRRSIQMVHENLVLTREVRSVPERQLYFIVRDFIAGTTLQRLIDSGHAFPPEQVMGIVRQVLGGLKPIHRIGLAHGGIKPSNIFLAPGDRVVVGDPSLPSHGLTLEFDRLTYDYRYAPPELFTGQREIEPRSDFFSIGCLAYELCQGQPPFAGENPFELAMKILRDPIPPLRCDRAVFARGAGAAFLDRLLARPIDGRFPGLREATRALDLIPGPEDEGFTPALRASPGPAGGPPAPPAPAPATPPGPDRPSSESLSGMVADRALAPDPAMHSIISFHGFRDDTLSLQGDGPSNQTFSFSVSTEAPRFVAPGQIGRYEIVETIGQGGMGSVYRARDLTLQRLVALKVAPRRPGVADEQWARFNREAKAVARLQHPNIVQIHDVGRLDDAQYLVLELVEGESLRELLARGPLPPDDAARLVATMARAVHFAHERGVLHRDLKPANILLTREGMPKITDFGLAKFVASSEPMLGMDSPGEGPDANTTQAGMVLGTPNYMAPEQAVGLADEIGPGVDVYALGVILYEALTGRRPFVGHSVTDILMQVQSQVPPAPDRIRAEVPAALGAICLKCLEKQPSARYATAGMLAEDLERFLVNLPVRARPQAAAGPPRLKGRWFRFWSK